MPRAFAELTKEALELAPAQRLELAASLLESTDSRQESEVEAAWDEEILRRLQAIEEGREIGVSLEEAMQKADRLLAS